MHGLDMKQQSLSNMVWKAEALKRSFLESALCTSNNHQDKQKEKNILERREEKEICKQQTNKEPKKK
jgi:hypothetical protein